jgi:hypothetical protein
LIKDAEDEYKRRGAFKRIFPSVDFLYYKQFFEESRPLNYFLDAQLMSRFRIQNPLSIKNDEKLPKFLQFSDTNNPPSKEVLSLAKQIHPPRRIADKLLQ